MINEEKNIKEKIISLIDKKQSFCFNAGAGSGKTHSLMETITYILNNNSKALKKNNQKVMVITYTNVAVQEIKNRLGYSDLIEVSTIHTRLWELIKNFKEDILKLHVNLMKSRIEEFKGKIESLVFKNDEKLNNNCANQEFIKKFYDCYNLRANEFKSEMQQFTDVPISNVSNFKTYVSSKRKIICYNETLRRIELKEKKYKQAIYDPFYNEDKLDRMKFSHDTLINFAKELISNSNILKKIIVDCYPYILMDEFQDADSRVIEILYKLDLYGSNKVIIGYFGDCYQKIYGDGVGEKLFSIHLNLEKVDKKYNRRSMKRIVDVANKIRTDFQQISYTSEEGCFDSFYVNNNEDQVINDIIARSISDFSITKDNNLHCFLLKNEYVADRTHFGDLYKLFKDSNYYSGSNYNQLNSELLSDDVTKLGRVPLLLYKIVKLYKDINNSELQVTKIIPQEVINKINYKKLKDILYVLKTMECQTLEVYLNSLCDVIKKDNNIRKTVLNHVNIEEEFNLQNIKNYIYNNLCNVENDEELIEYNNIVVKMLDLNMNILINWYNYITLQVEGNVQFHTFHGTKGLGFDNVLIIITNEFNRSQSYFRDFFKNLDNLTTDRLIEIRNLLYVAITRAKNKLRVVYIDNEYNKIKEQYERIFENTIEFIN